MVAKYTNNASADLALSITNVATSMTVNTGLGALFPSLGAGEFFYATLVDESNNLEIVKVTARSGDTMTIVRAQDGTTARAYSAGSKVELRIVAAGLSNFGQLDATQTFTGSNTFTQTITGSISGNAGTVTNGVYTTGNQTVGGVKTFSSAPVVPDNSFGLSKIAQISTASILGRSTAGTGNVEALTAAQALTLVGGDNANNLTTGTVATARLGSGTADSTTFLRGDQTWQVVTQPQVDFALFAASGTWTCPAGVTKVRVTVVGGGGGSASGANTRGGPGGIAYGIYSVTPATDYSVTVGAGGAGSTSVTASAGGTSSFSTFASATGGGGANSSSGGASGAGTGGNISNSKVPANEYPYAYGASQNNVPNFAGLGTRVQGTTVSQQTAAIAWSASGGYLPGAPGNTATSGYTIYARGGIGGAVLIEYVG